MLCGAPDLPLKKGKELYKAIAETKAEVASSRKPTYWPTDPRKRPDLLDFFVLKKIPQVFTHAENMSDLSSDHTAHCSPPNSERHHLPQRNEK